MLNILTNYQTGTSTLGMNKTSDRLFVNRLSLKKGMEINYNWATVNQSKMQCL